MSEFTRGNWVILPPDDIENSYLIEAQSEDGIIETGTLICECYDEANTRLIAAAPKLYNCLKAYYEALSYTRPDLAYVAGKILAKVDGTWVGRRYKSYSSRNTP